jgi:hypothetical protein
MPSRGETVSASPDSEQLKASTRLYQLADEARAERAQWSDRMTTVRRELAHLADQHLGRGRHQVHPQIPRHPGVRRERLPPPDQARRMSNNPDRSN